MADPRCERGRACECVGDRRQLGIFCPHLNAEQPYDAVDFDSIAAWRTLSPAVRGRCLAHLRDKVPADVIDKWREQLVRGIKPGSESIRFHLEVGMALRNALRAVVTDDQLPSGNWDDYYVGALDELAGAEPKLFHPERQVNRGFRQRVAQFCKAIAKLFHLRRPSWTA